MQAPTTRQGAAKYGERTGDCCDFAFITSDTRAPPAEADAHTRSPRLPKLHARLVAIDELDTSPFEGGAHGLIFRESQSRASFKASHG